MKNFWLPFFFVGMSSLIGANQAAAADKLHKVRIKNNETVQGLRIHSITVKDKAGVIVGSDTYDPPVLIGPGGADHTFSFKRTGKPSTVAVSYQWGAAGDIVSTGDKSTSKCFTIPKATSVAGPGDGFDCCVLGACCSSEGTCGCLDDSTSDECLAPGYFFPDTPCDEACVDGNCIPTVSQWGLAVMLLLVLTAGTVAILRRRAAVA